MKNPIYCATCDKKSMELVVGRYVTSIKHDGRAYAIELDDLQYYQCQDCKESIFPDAASKRIGRELRQVAGLLQPEQIKSGRLKEGLTQCELAERLGVAEATICRWETGGQIQQVALDKSMRMFFDVPEARSYSEVLKAVADLPHRKGHAVWIADESRCQIGCAKTSNVESESDTTRLEVDSVWNCEESDNCPSQYELVG